MGVVELNVIPDYIQETLLDAVLTDMRQGNYVSAATNSRNILRLGRVGKLRSDVQSAAKRVATVLEQRGYSEKEFLREMAVMADQNCPVGAIPMDEKDMCPDGYFPLFADRTDKSTRRCCAKLQDSFKQMDQDVQNMHRSIPDTQLKIEFENRFMVKDPVVRQSRDEMFGVGITPHISQFLARYQDSETKRLEEKLKEVDEQKVPVQNVLGDKMTPGLYAYMKSVLGGIPGLAVWMVRKDWTVWWLAIYVFRFVALFGCLYLKAANMTQGFYDAMSDLASEWFGIKATVAYVRQVVFPNILAILLSTSLVSAVGSMAMNFGSWINSVLGTFSLTSRLVSMFSQVGFAMDVYFVLRDLASFGWATMKAVGEEVSAGNVNPFTIVNKGLSTYCDRTLHTFFAFTFNTVGEMTAQLFSAVCLLVSKALGQTLGGLACEAFMKLLKTALEMGGRTSSMSIGSEEGILPYVDRMSSANVTNMGDVISMPKFGGSLG